MRNIITLNKGRLRPTSSADIENGSEVPLSLLDNSFDTLNDSITCVLGNLEVGKLEVLQFMKDGSRNVLALFNVQTFDDELLSFAHFSSLNQLIFVFKQGDIVSATYDPETFDPNATKIEILGSIDSGIATAEWSSDEENLALVTEENNVVVLSKFFEPINEYQLQIEDLKMSQHVNVGWGKKETQFRGKGVRAMERKALESLKASGLVGNELRDPTMPYMVDSGVLSSLDNRELNISWRGDCEYFAVSSIETVMTENETPESIERRVLRIFTREGQLTSVSEPVDGMEHNLSWKPQGSLIASIQRKSHIPGEESLDLIFFERNGLRHGEFDTRLPLEESVKSLCWNNNSEILTIVLDHKIQLWTTKNYHWYLKQEIYAENVLSAKWHPEKEFTLMYSNDQEVYIVDFAYKMSQGPTLEPFDNGTSIVIDGTTVNITPLRVANVPPPIYYRDFETPEAVIDVAVNISNEIYAALNRNALVLASIPSLEDMKQGQHPNVRCIMDKSDFASVLDEVRQVAFINESIVAVLLDSNNLSRIAIIDVQDVTRPNIVTVTEVFDKVLLLKSTFDYNRAVYETRDGTIMQIDAEGQTEVVAKFPQLVSDFRVKRVHDTQSANLNQWSSASSELIAFGLTSNGKLYANDTQLASAVTSIEITSTFLLFTTAHHYLQFIHLNTTKFKPVPTVEGQVIDERVRAIERGSILVSVMPSNSAVILQASRGNLETIFPRIMVLSKIRKEILAKEYLKAFIICRTHRVNLDILHDYDSNLFYENLELFINQIERVDYLDLFISCLIEEDVTKTKYKETTMGDISQALELESPALTEMQQYMKKKMFDPTKSKVNKICQAMLNVFLSSPEYKKKYLQSILTAYASQNPQNLKDALKAISELQDPKEQDNCVTYICFLQDVNKVYNEALASYNVKLSLSIAQKSQMDPREYLPFLQKLYEQTPLERQFTIDDYLKKYESALTNLIELEKEEKTISTRTIEYVESHNLYKHALTAYRYDVAKQNCIYAVFAKQLTAQQEYNEAGIIYQMLEDYKEALNSFKLGKKWREAVAIAKQYCPDELVETCEELVSSLTFDHKYSDVAEIQLHFLNNNEEAMINYCKAFMFSDAMLVAIKQGENELLEKVIDPGLSEGFGTVAELLADCKGQVNSQLKRLRELRAKKEENPYAFYGEESEQADDVSIAPSETSTKESFFTRYTGKTGGTAKTGVSRKTSKNKRREERKRARGKKGTIYEEEYLIQSIGRLIERLDQTRPDAAKLIEGLCIRNMREQAYLIQKQFSELLQLLQGTVTEIYTINQKDRERIDENGEVYYLPELPIPVIKEFAKCKVVDF